MDAEPKPSTWSGRTGPGRTSESRSDTSRNSASSAACGRMSRAARSWSPSRSRTPWASAAANPVVGQGPSGGRFVGGGAEQEQPDQRRSEPNRRGWPAARRPVRRGRAPGGRRCPAVPGTPVASKPAARRSAPSRSMTSGSLNGDVAAGEPGYEEFTRPAHMPGPLGSHRESTAPTAFGVARPAAGRVASGPSVLLGGEHGPDPAVVAGPVPQRVPGARPGRTAGSLIMSACTPWARTACNRSSTASGSASSMQTALRRQRNSSTTRARITPTMAPDSVAAAIGPARSRPWVPMRPTVSPAAAPGGEEGGPADGGHFDLSKGQRQGPRLVGHRPPRSRVPGQCRAGGHTARVGA